LPLTSKAPIPWDHSLIDNITQIFGKKDTHVPPQGRDLIRKTLHDAGVTFSFYEPAWAQHAFIRDELSK
jgi:carboxymethylenebutenolidase